MRRFPRALFVFILVMWGSLNESPAANDEKKETAVPRPPEKIVVAKTEVIPPAPRHPDPSIVEIQKQLQEILQTHRTLELQRQQELAEVQKILDQSRMHHELVKDLNRKPAGSPLPAKPEMDEALRRQKIQLIEEQALKNRTKLENLKKKKQAQGKK